MFYAQGESSQELLIMVFLRSQGRVVLALLLVMSLACTPTQTQITPLGQSNFEDYRRQTLQWMEQRRAFQTPDPQAELAWNAPREWRPTSPATRGVLLVHGLGDSPWSFYDLGAQLVQQGFLVRSLLLPGHGTQPADMLHVRLEDWQRLIAEQVAILEREVSEVFLGGFSTGANLTFEYAATHSEIAGLLLFSPAFQANTSYDWLAPFISWVKPWLRSPEDKRSQNAVRYMNMPTNGFAQFYRSSQLVRAWLDNAQYTKPVLMVVAEHDSVLNTHYLLESFQARFTHPDSRLIWYGQVPKSADSDPRILVQSDALPTRHISQFSHMSPLFAPDNPLYGEQGSLRICWNGQDAQATHACELGAPVWFSDWGYREIGKIHARLTYNPYFSWQTQVMFEVMGLGSTQQKGVQNSPPCCIANDS